MPAGRFEDGLDEFHREVQMPHHDSSPKQQSQHWMRSMVAVASLIAPISPSRIFAQNPVQPTFANCAASSSHVFSEREVQVVARLVGDPAALPRVSSPRDSDANTVAVTVDTSGAPEPGSLIRVRMSNAALWKEAETTYRTWHFRPAIASGCKVRQRVTVAIHR
jgi:hypothetical protein